MSVCGVSDPEPRIRELFDIASLSDAAQDPVGTWSFGMRRKLGIVEALGHDPALLIMDEPTIGLDPPFELALADIIRSRCDRGLATVIAGNDATFTESVATWCAFIADRTYRNGRYIKGPDRIGMSLAGDNSDHR